MMSARGSQDRGGVGGDEAADHLEPHVLGGELEILDSAPAFHKSGALHPTLSTVPLLYKNK